MFAYSSFLGNLPRLSFADVHRLVNRHSTTPRSKLDKGYSLFFEKFIHDYEGKRLSLC